MISRALPKPVSPDCANVSSCRENYPAADHTKQQGGTLRTVVVSNRGHRQFVVELQDWSGLRSVVSVESHREQVGSGEKSVQ